MLLFKKVKSGKKESALFSEYIKVIDEMYSLPMVKLDKPYFKYWKVIPKLREDVARRKDASLLLKVIKLGYKTYVIYKVNKVVTIREGKYDYYERIYDWKKKKYEMVERSFLRFNRLSVEEFEKIEPKLKKHFFKVKRKGKEVYQCNLPKYFVKLKVRKNLITHEILFTRKLQKRLKELENYLTNHNLMNRLYYTNNSWKEWQIENYKYLKKEKHIKNELSQI